MWYKEDELREDAYGLVGFYEWVANDFTVDDIEGALNFYQEVLLLFQERKSKK